MFNVYFSFAVVSKKVGAFTIGHVILEPACLSFVAVPSAIRQTQVCSTNGVAVGNLSFIDRWWLMAFTLTRNTIGVLGHR
ncbi:hypothetical protein [Spirosoma aerophilum]